MNQNNNLSVLPFYRSIKEQNHRKSYAYGKIYPLFTEYNTVLPFQIMRAKRDNDIQSVLLCDINGIVVADITDDMKNTGLQVVKLADIDVIVYTGTFPMALNQFEGQYYLTLSDGVETWYSEVYTVVNNLGGYIKIEWGDVENLVFDDGVIIYENPRFVNILYLCTELGKPEYIFEEEGENRDGYFFATKQISEKKYRCTILAPEYLCDVMRLIRMADFIRVTDQYGRVYNCDTFLITPEWQVQGDLASVEIEFETDTVVKKNAKGYIITDNGDFNEDFNEDFNNN